MCRKSLDEWLQWGMLGVVLFLLLLLGPGRFWEHKLDQGYPFAYNGVDAFQHQGRSEGILALGDYKYEPVEHFQGEFANFPSYYPPLLDELSAVWASFPSLETYVSTPSLAFLATILSAIIMYCLIRRYNPHVALLSLPLYAYMFLTPTSLTYFSWGHWPHVLGHVFLVVIAWLLSRQEMAGWESILVLAFVGLIMSYTALLVVEAVFLLMVVFLHVAVGEPLRLLRKFIPLGMLIILLTLPTIVMVVNIWSPYEPFYLHICTECSGCGGIPAIGFPGIPGVALWAMAAVLTAVLVVSLKRGQGMSSSMALLFSLVMFLFGFSNYIGFSWRAFFVRQLWPITLAPFLGVTLYFGGTVVLKGLRRQWTTPLAAIVAMLAISLIVFTAHKPSAGLGAMNPPSGIMTPELWDAIMWIRDSTPPNASVAVMYGDNFIGEIFWNLQRPFFLVTTQGFLEPLLNLSVRRDYKSVAGTEAQPIRPFYPTALSRKNPFVWGWVWNMSQEGTLFKERDLCAADYVIFTKESYLPSLEQYSRYLSSLLLKKPGIALAYQNDQILILHNTKPGDVCVETKEIE